LLVHYDSIAHTQLGNYVYGTSNADAANHSVIAFGLGMMFNHRARSNPRHNVAHFWDRLSGPISKVSDQTEAHTTFSGFSFDATRKVARGQELCVSYGSDEWFTARGIEVVGDISNEAKPAYHDIDEMLKHGHCMTDVRVVESLIPMAGRGAFAKRSFKEGEEVDMSAADVVIAK
jgi:hypothetical protein